LKSYLSSNISDAETFSKLAGAADIPVITKQKTDTEQFHRGRKKCGRGNSAMGVQYLN